MIKCVFHNKKAEAYHKSTCFRNTLETLENIFPELKKSEDEQSKEWILEYLRDGLQKSDEQFKGQFKAAINWLEKQGEQSSNILHDMNEEPEEQREFYY